MKRSSTAKAVPTKRQAAGALAKLAKAHGKTEAEIELDAVKALSRANAAEVERLRAERDALAPDAADYQHQREAEVLVAQLTDQPVPMPLRPAQALRMLRRAQAANADLASRADVTSRLDKIEQAVAAAKVQPTKRKKHYPVSRKRLCDIVREHGGELSDDTVLRMDNFEHEPIAGYSADTVRISEAAAHLWAKSAAYATKQLKRPGKRTARKMARYNENMKEHNKANDGTE